jgi:hypothetical protein
MMPRYEAQISAPSWVSSVMRTSSRREPSARSSNQSPPQGNTRSRSGEASVLHDDDPATPARRRSDVLHVDVHRDLVQELHWRPRRRHDSELLDHAESIEESPLLLDDPSACDAKDRHLGHPSSSRSAHALRPDPVRCARVMADELRRIERHRSRRPARRRNSADRGDGSGVLALAIGGTVVVTGLNAPARFGEAVSEGELRQI